MIRRYRQLLMVKKASVSFTCDAFLCTRVSNWCSDELILSGLNRSRLFKDLLKLGNLISTLRSSEISWQVFLSSQLFDLSREVSASPHSGILRAPSPFKWRLVALNCRSIVRRQDSNCGRWWSFSTCGLSKSSSFLSFQPPLLKPLILAFVCFFIHCLNKCTRPFKITGSAPEGTLERCDIPGNPRWLLKNGYVKDRTRRMGETAGRAKSNQCKQTG